MGYIGNAPYQGVLTGGNIQDGTVETTDLANGAVTTVKLGDGQVTAGKLAATLDLTGKTVTLPAGVGGHASGTEANRPAAPAIGTIYFNTDEDTLQQYTSAGWENIGVIPPAISSISGAIYNTIATNLTISGASFGVAATVRFAYGESTSDVSVTPSSDTEITVAVPSAVYNQAGGTSVTISVIASGQVSNGSSKTVVGLPTGGTVTTSGGYLIHTFLSSSSFVVPSGLTLNNVEYLVIAGGGGGGYGGGLGGGGGAGGYRASVSGESSGGGGSAESPLSITGDSTYTVTIGPGGAGGTISASRGSENGFNSVFGPITSIGGGGGGGSSTVGNAAQEGGSGGSGGGGGENSGGLGPGGLATSGQGFAGGTGATAGTYGGAGGGGASEAGANGSAANGGLGGDGISSSITGSPVPRGGGGGGAPYARAFGTVAGGNGGGGTGADANFSGSPASTAGASFTGGGGGGRTSGNGQSGGSGIVIVRYQLT
jgi:hypothetical protein